MPTVTQRVRSRKRNPGLGHSHSGLSSQDGTGMSDSLSAGCGISLSHHPLLGPFRGRGPTGQGGPVPLAYPINPVWSPIPGLIPEARAESSRQSRPLGPILAIGPPTPPSRGLAPLWVAPQEQSGLHSIAGPRPPWLRTEAWPRPLTRIEETTDQQQMQPWRR